MIGKTVILPTGDRGKIIAIAPDIYTVTVQTESGTQDYRLTEVSFEDEGIKEER